MLVNTDSLYLQLSVCLGKRFSCDNDLQQHQVYWFLTILEEAIIPLQISTPDRENIPCTSPSPPLKKPSPASWSLSDSEFLPENYKTRHKPVSLGLAKMSEYLKICGCGVPSAFIQRTDSHSGNWGMPNSILVKDFTEL